jgi:hypothetical protein
VLLGVATYSDAEGHTTSGTSTPTTVLDDSSETIAITVSTTENHVFTATPVITDDAAAGSVNYAWQVSTDHGASWATVQSGASNSYTPGEAQDGSLVQVVATYTDAEGHTTSGTSTPTTVLEDSSETIATLSASFGAASVNENSSVALNIVPTFEHDPGATNTIMITGLAAGESLTNGLSHTFTGSTITLTHAELAGLMLHAADDESRPSRCR